MLRDIIEQLAVVLRDEVGATLAADGIDAEIEPRLVVSPSEAICLDIYPGAPSRTSDGAGFGDIAGFYALTVRARASVNDGTEAQDILVDMTDDLHQLSVAAALEGDQTLDGWATFVAVDADSFSGIGVFPPDVSMVGCTWRVLVGQAVS